MPTEAERRLAETRARFEEAKEEIRLQRREQARIRREEADRERNEFRAELEAEGLLDVAATQEVRDKVWSMAWDQGHSSGFNDVRYHYEDYAELVNLVIGGAQ